VAKNETALDRALAAVNDARGLSNEQKRDLKQEIRQGNINSNAGSVREALAAAQAAARQGRNPAPVDPNPGFKPGGPIQTGPTPPKVNVPMPNYPPGDGLYWTPIFDSDNIITGWQPTPIPGYEAPGEKPGFGEKEREGAQKRLTDLLTQYGLESLIPTVKGLVDEWGANNDSIIMSYLRDSDTYKERFKGNQDRIKNGYAAMSEAEYIGVETEIRAKMRDFGLDGAFYNNERIASLIGGDVSASEVTDRLTKAKKIVDNADVNIRNSLTSLYGATLGDLYGYVLDPALAQEGLQRKVNAGIAYGVAQSNNLEIDRSLAEQVGDLTYGDERTVRQSLGQAGELARSVKRLQSMESDIDLTDADVVEQQFGLDAESGKKVKKLQSRERARFSGSSGAFGGTLNGSTGY
jgi:hypothetical protein